MIVRHDSSMTVEEYLKLDAASPFRHEYFPGRSYSLQGDALERSRIAVNVLATCSIQLASKGYGIFGSDLRLKSPSGFYAYPDVSITNSEAYTQMEHDREYLLNPQMIVEVLSPSTEGYDQGNKFHGYRSIPTLAAYVLIAQDRPFVEVRLKNDEGNWVIHFAEGIDLVIAIPPLGLRLTGAKIYRNVRWPEPSLPADERIPHA